MSDLVDIVTRECSCEWTYEGDDAWTSSCGRYWPERTDIEFCPFCGGEIEWIKNKGSQDLGQAKKIKFKLQN